MPLPFSPLLQQQTWFFAANCLHPLIEGNSSGDVLRRCCMQCVFFCGIALSHRWLLMIPGVAAAVATMIFCMDCLRFHALCIKDSCTRLMIGCHGVRCFHYFDTSVCRCEVDKFGIPRKILPTASCSEPLFRLGPVYRISF